MMSQIDTHAPKPAGKPRRLPDRLLMGSGVLWYLIALVGQIAFVYFIIAYYGVRTVSGDFTAWNDKPIIDGYIENDQIGNTGFAVHVLLAAVLTFGGLLQLIPNLRRRAPAFHRWNGRVFITTAVIMAVSGLVLTWGRGTYLSVISAFAISIDGLLILWFAMIALHRAITRRIDEHRRWAMRTFMAANGVWFFRVGIMAWLILNQGPVGMNNTLSGPADIFLAFGCYLIPLAILEIYFRAQASTRATVKISTSLLVVGATIVTAVGVFGTVALMWRPYL